LNGANNIHAFAIDLPTESQPTEDSSVSIENQNSSQLPDTNTTKSDIQQQSPDAQNMSLLASNEPEPEIAPATESATETVITSALEDTTATSTALPVVEAQESDLRDTTSSLALALEVQLEPQQNSELDTEFKPSTSNMDGALEASSLTFNPVTANLPPPPPPSDPVADQAALLFDGGQATTATPEVKDAEMADAPESNPFTKVSREREDDIDDEPSAKRTKTEEDTTMADVSTQEFAAPEAPSATQNAAPAPANSETTAISDYEGKEIVKILKNIVRTKDGKNFKQPVRTLWPTFADSYYAKISHPVDLATMETNLRDHKYASMDQFKAEVNLIADNAVNFNGEGHAIAISGQVVRDAILNKMASIPPEPVAVPKAPKKQARQSTPRAENAPRTTPARRQSRSGGTAPAVGVTPAPTFALDPTTNTPLIRRDSTKGDSGRPKREIHPPKNKDLPYATTRPKNKKTATELKFVEEVLAELKKPKHAQYSHPFLLPVDPVSMGIPNYFQVIKHPMDVSKAEQKMRAGEYQSAKGFELDMKLMFANCYKFNPPGNPVHHMGKQFEDVFNELWANKSQWLAEHAPAAQTPSSNGGSDEEESGEEEEVEEPATGPNSIAALSERLNEEQEKLINLMTSAKKDQQMIEMQKDMIELIKGKIVAAKAKAPTKKMVKKAKAPKPPKKQAPAKKSGAAATKKSAPARQKYLGTHEKNIISIGIQRLPEDVIKGILDMIKNETDVDVSVH
jgi:bromodomain-containing factor 1